MKIVLQIHYGIAYGMSIQWHTKGIPGHDCVLNRLRDVFLRVIYEYKYFCGEEIKTVQNILF